MGVRATVSPWRTRSAVSLSSEQIGIDQHGPRAAGPLQNRPRWSGSCSTRHESEYRHVGRASQTHCGEERVSDLVNWFVCCARRKKSKAMFASSFCSRSIRRDGSIPTVFALLFACMHTARAGGPRYIAGISYFNQGTAGTPLTWSQGEIVYYTDQGSLSSTVSGPQGDALVADAFSQWTSIRDRRCFSYARRTARGRCQRR